MGQRVTDQCVNYYLVPVQYQSEYYSVLLPAASADLYSASASVFRPGVSASVQATTQCQCVSKCALLQVASASAGQY